MVIIQLKDVFNNARLALIFLLIHSHKHALTNAQHQVMHKTLPGDV